MPETEMQKLFKTHENNANIPRGVDAEVIFTDAPYIQYEWIKLDNNFRTYLESTLMTENVLRTGIKPTPYQKTYEINTGSQSHEIDFWDTNKKILFLRFSLVYDKSDQHRSIYDSYNLEVATKKIKSIKLENASSSYSSLNSLKFDLENDHDQYLPYCQFVAWYCKGSSIAPLTDLRRGKGHMGEIQKLNQGW